MSEDRSSNEQKSWLNKLTQAFAHEPKNRQELLEVLRDAHQNKLLDSEALAIVEGAIQVADLQVRDIMVPRAQMVSVRRDDPPDDRFQPAIPQRGAGMVRGQLDPKRLGLAPFEVPGLNDPEEPRFEAGRHMRRQQLKADARVRELARERGISHEGRHQDHPPAADVIEHAGEHAAAQDVPCTAAVGHAPEQARTGCFVRHRAAIPVSKRSAVAQSSGSSMLKPYGGGMR